MATIAYEKYSKSLIESFQKTLRPEKDFVDKNKGAFNAEVHAALQLVYHRVLTIGTGIMKTIDDLSSNRFMVDPKKPADVKGTVKVLVTIQNEVNKYLQMILNYNLEFPNKVKRVLPTVSRDSDSVTESKIRKIPPSKITTSLSGTSSSRKESSQTDQTTSDSSPVKSMRPISPLGRNDGITVLNGTLNRILGQLKTNQSENTEMMTDQLAEQRYQAGLNKAVPVEKNVAEKKEKEKESKGGGIGSLIGAIMKPLLSFTEPMAKLIPGMLRLLGMNKVAGLMGRIPGLGLLTTATAGVIAIDYLNKNPEAIGKITETIGDVVKFTVTALGKLVGTNLPKTAMTIGTLIVETTKAIYLGFVDSIKDSITEGSWGTVAAELTLFGTTLWMAVNKLRKLATKFTSMIPNSLGGGVADDLIDDVGGVDASGNPRANRQARRGATRTGSRTVRGSKLKGAGRYARKLGGKALKGGVAGIAVGLAADIGFGLADDAMGINEENRYNQSGAKAAYVGTADTASYALQGAAFGAMFGPIGMGVGAAAGALFGLGKTLKGFDDANGKSREAIAEETRLRLINNGIVEDEAKKRANVLSELIDSETITKTGNKETQKFVNAFADAKKQFDEAKKTGDVNQIRNAQMALGLATKNLKYDNRDVFWRQTELGYGIGIKTSAEREQFFKDAEEAMKAYNKALMDETIKKREIYNSLKLQGLSENEARRQSQLPTNVDGYARGGDVSDGLHSVGENGMEFYHKKGSQTKVFNKADSNLKSALASEFQNIGENQSISLTKKIVESGADQAKTIGSILENTVTSLLTQMSELKTSKAETPVMNNQSNQNVVNNYNTNNSVMSSGVESYSRVQKFVPRFA